MTAGKFRAAIVVAGGRGMRLGGDTPKQFLRIGGKPLMVHSLRALEAVEGLGEILLALPKAHIPEGRAILQAYKLADRVRIIVGGQERFNSVKNCLDSICESQGTVAIHDAARPFITTAFAEGLYKEAEANGSAVPVIPVADSLRMQLKEDDWVAVDRSRFRIIQTPQVFDLEKLKEAYETSFKPNFTDDASVYEAAGHKVHLVEGLNENFKITTPKDWQYANWLIEHTELHV